MKALEPFASGSEKDLSTVVAGNDEPNTQLSHCFKGLQKGTDEETDGGGDSTDEESDGQREDSTNMNINEDRDGSIQTTWDSNARKGKRQTPPTMDDEGTPESPSEDSDRDVADTGKDGGPRKSGRIRKTPPPAPKPKPRPRKKVRRKAQVGVTIDRG